MFDYPKYRIIYVDWDNSFEPQIKSGFFSPWRAVETVTNMYSSFGPRAVRYKTKEEARITIDKFVIKQENNLKLIKEREALIASIDKTTEYYTPKERSKLEKVLK